MKTNLTSSTASRVDLQSTSARPWLEWGVALFSTWFVVGVYLDGWAHIHSLPEGFFTPWHAIIYSGFLGAALVLVGTGFLARRQGVPWYQALPAGYGLSLLGAGIFLIAGLADFFWHEVFGIETDIEAIYSPPHLLLVAGGALIASGPLRAAWYQSRTSQPARWRAVLSLTLLLAIFTFFTAEFHPLVHPWASVRFRPLALTSAELGLPATPVGGLGSQDMAGTIGIGSILIQSGLLMALLMFMIRRWGAQLPLGWLTFIFSLNAAGLSILHTTPWAIPVAVVAGIVADGLYRWLQPSVQQPKQSRLWSAFVPVVFYSLYFLTLQMLEGVWWPIHVWAGGIVLAGVIGWLISYLPLPIALPYFDKKM